MRIVWRAVAAVGLITGAALPAAAQSPAAYPTRPITMIVPFATGGSVDAVARVLKPHLERDLGQPIVLDYRPGGATTLGAAAVARARPDGYTLGIVVEAFAVNPGLYRSLPYDTLADLVPVTLIGVSPIVIAVNAASPHDTLPKLIAAARARPGTMSYATVGAGSMNHLAAELLSRAAEIRLIHVPYRGGGPAVTDLIGRHVDMMMMSVALARPHLDSGALRALAVASERRLPALPQVPTATEAGVPGLQASAWQAVVAPAGTPREVVERVQRAYRGALEVAGVREALGNLGMVVVASSPDAFGAFLRAEIETWGRVVREANIRPE